MVEASGILAGGRARLGAPAGSIAMPMGEGMDWYVGAEGSEGRCGGAVGVTAAARPMEPAVAGVPASWVPLETPL